MTITIYPPAFNKTMSNERYKRELLAWKEVTDLSSRKQAIVVALSLPEEDGTHIRDKVFDQLPLEELKKENGLSLLVTFFDKHLAKDDLSDSLEKFTDFENCERREGQTICDFDHYFDPQSLPRLFKTINRWLIQTLLLLILFQQLTTGGQAGYTHTKMIT